MKEGSKIHLIDGTYELFRAFYGAPGRRGEDGREVGATVGFCRSMLLLLRQPEVTHVACAFDHVIESFRNDLFCGYKTAEGIDPRLLAQFPLVEEGARAMGLVVWPMVEFEADDALATGALRWSRQVGVEQIVLCSPDKDLAQCVSGDRVVCQDRRRQKTLDEAGVWEKFGVGPASIPDYLALVGDRADGIPGLGGWGARSASRVLARYPHLEEIPEEASSWEVAIPRAQVLAARLAAERNSALLYRELARLRTDVPLKEEAEDLLWEGIEGDSLARFCARLGYPRLLEEARSAGNPR